MRVQNWLLEVSANLTVWTRANLLNQHCFQILITIWRLQGQKFLYVIPFETEEDAIKIANDPSYGLTIYIQSQDSAKVHRVARKLRSGMVDVNGAGIAVDAPFGGFKHSGIGREAGEHGLEEFLEVKAVGGWSN